MVVSISLIFTYIKTFFKLLKLQINVLEFPVFRYFSTQIFGPLEPILLFLLTD